jgi:hypothetical protein
MSATTEETKKIFKKDKLENQKNKPEGYTIERSTPSVCQKNFTHIF